MSFALTSAQVRGRTKTVTRRLGWRSAKPGDVVQPIVKGQGLNKGDRVERIGGPIRFVNVQHELLDDIHEHPGDTAREGLPELLPADFVQMFGEHNRCRAERLVTRIEFEYVERA